MIVFLKGDGSFCARVVTRVVERVGVCDRSTVRLFCVHGLAVHNELLDERASDCVCVCVCVYMLMCTMITGYTSLYIPRGNKGAFAHAIMSQE